MASVLTPAANNACPIPKQALTTHESREAIAQRVIGSNNTIHTHRSQWSTH